MADEVVHAALTHVGDLQDAIGDGLGEVEFPAQVGDYLVGEEPLELEGDAGQGEHYAARVFDDEGRGGAVGVIDDDGALRDVGQALVVGGHDEAPALEAALELLDKARFEDEPPAGGVGDYLSGQVVLGRAESAPGDDDVGAVEGVGDDLFHAARVVADHGLVEEVDAEVGEALGHPCGVGVDDLAEQELGTYGDYFGVGHLILRGFRLIPTKSRSAAADVSAPRRVDSGGYPLVSESPNLVGVVAELAQYLGRVLAQGR